MASYSYKLILFCTLLVLLNKDPRLEQDEYVHYVLMPLEC